ncbi:ubiquitin-activating enzyme E1 3-like [Triticum dicoccoides]|uniref:ubiquitin-activating enzyme E1 3-like n=1 Tax=Triticum dicoccoides TaxID=85692 RepID=UPI00188EED8F|nr:ubiquitin-activating enzyme E1 3-like [Triticum dicoccoides]
MGCLRRLLRRGLLAMLRSKRPSDAAAGDKNGRGGDAKRPRLVETEGAGGSGGQNRAAPQEIDEDLHSRQLAVYGRKTMRRLFASDVLVSRLNGLGAEIDIGLESLDVLTACVGDGMLCQLNWELLDARFSMEWNLAMGNECLCLFCLYKFVYTKGLPRYCILDVELSWKILHQCPFHVYVD